MEHNCEYDRGRARCEYCWLVKKILLNITTLTREMVPNSPPVIARILATVQLKSLFINQSEYPIPNPPDSYASTYETHCPNGDSNDQSPKPT